MEYGDSTLVGERGGKLSGGQQTRVALARAVYADSDVYILDDPFASLDNSTSAQIWQLCICDVLKARGKAVVLASQRASVLGKCDELMVLEKGEPSYLGPPSGMAHEFASVRSFEAPMSESTESMNATERLTRLQSDRKAHGLRKPRVISSELIVRSFVSESTELMWATERVTRLQSDRKIHSLRQPRVILPN